MPIPEKLCGHCGKARVGRQRCCSGSGSQLAADDVSFSLSPHRQTHPSAFRVTRSGSGPLSLSSNLASPTKRRQPPAKKPTKRTTRPVATRSAQNVIPPVIFEPITLFSVGPSPPVVPLLPSSQPASTTPSASPPVQPTSPPHQYTSYIPTKQGRAPLRDDIWQWMRQLSDVELKPYEDHKIIPENSKPPLIGSLPRSAYVGCLFCEQNGGKFQPYNNKNSQSSTIEKHLQAKHADAWEKACTDAGIQMKVTKEKPVVDDPRDEPFSLEGMMKYLLKWVVTDDQPLNVVDCPEFRRFVLYCSRELSDKDIPHRTTTTKAMVVLFEKLMAKWREELRNTPGRISFTTDMWSDPQQRPFMAVTAHYIHETEFSVELRSRLIAFRHVPGSHDGATLGSHFVNILLDFQIHGKVGQITADNASNNQTMLAWMEDALEAHGIDFSRTANRLRCFPHIIHLAVLAFLDALRHTPNHRSIDTKFLKVLQSDVVARCRDLVVTSRQGAVRQEDYRQTLIELKTAGRNPPPLALIYDVSTRWSATFNMIDRYLCLEEVVKEFLKKDRNYELMKEKALGPDDAPVLRHILSVLHVFHRSQELLSSERTPTLSLVLPAYEAIRLILHLRVVNNYQPHLNFAIRAALEKLNGYVELARQNTCYGLSMFLNPSSKTSWMEKHWTAAELELVLRNVREAVLKYIKQERMDAQQQQQQSVTSPTPTLSSSSSSANPYNQAARSLSSGFGFLQGMLDELTRQPDANNLPSGANVDGHQSPPTSEEDQDRMDAARADAEIARYRADPVVANGVNGVDLLAWWQFHRSCYPLLWKVARDVLPAQASSVPSERVFSSSKHTTTQERNSLDPKMVERLQILKFGLKQSKLEFASGWIEKPEHMEGGRDIFTDED